MGGVLHTLLSGRVGPPMATLYEWLAGFLKPYWVVTLIFFLCTDVPVVLIRLVFSARLEPCPRSLKGESVVPRIRALVNGKGVRGGLQGGRLGRKKRMQRWLGVGLWFLGPAFSKH